MFENELDRLRYLLNDAKIPYEDIKEEVPERERMLYPDYFELHNNKYRRNQIIYGRMEDGNWKLDGICQLGSYGCAQGLIETYGEQGTDAEGDPLVLTADEVFQIIKEDWERSNDGFIF